MEKEVAEVGHFVQSEIRLEALGVLDRVLGRHEREDLRGGWKD
jgi:hypothetical protein